MFTLPFSLMAGLRIGAVIASLFGAWWLVDAIGDRRETTVRAELEPKIAKAENERDQWKAAHQQLLDEAKRLDDDNKEKLKGALAAKDRAEKLEAARVVPAPALERVRNPGS